MTRFTFQVFEKQTFIVLLFLTAAFPACRNQDTGPQLRVVLPHTALRDAPGERGREIRNLTAADHLTDLGGVSRFESQFRLGDLQMTAPWLQVQLTDGQTGWVFSGAVQPVTPDSNWLLDKRMHCYFGPDLTLRRHRWWSTRPNVADETDLAVFYHEALALRDTFTYCLGHRAEPNGAEVQPEFLWLREALPGFVFQRVARGTQPYLFTDYRYFYQLATRTTGAQDDQLMAVCLAAYPIDSIESPAPVWTMQIADEEVVSQLGLGHHLAMLQRIAPGLNRPGGLFQPDFQHLKEQILEDILGKNVRYWQPEEKILSELTEIIAATSVGLSATDRESLQLRRSMFENPADSGLRINLRAGE